MIFLAKVQPLNRIHAAPSTKLTFFETFITTRRYLISHSYNYAKPDLYNDDLDAAKRLFKGLENKERVILIDKDLTPPQVKYLISKMSFFVGTRMHANFAAIYTGVPVFGLAYSYKFKGAFDNNGQDSEKQTASVVNLTDSDIPKIISKVFTYYESVNT